MKGEDMFGRGGLVVFPFWEFMKSTTVKSWVA